MGISVDFKMSTFRYIKYIYILCVCLLVACSGGQSSSGNTTTPSSDNGSVIIGNIPTIPSSTSHSNYVLLPILNNKAQQITLGSAEIVIDNISVSPVSKYIDTSGCTSLAPGETCYLKLFTDQTNGYLINISYTDTSNHQIQLKQLVSFTNNLPEADGVIPPISAMEMPSKSLLSIPIVLDRPYFGIKAELDGAVVPVQCDEANNPNTCSIIVSSAQVNQMSKLMVTVYDSSDQTLTTNYTTTLTVSSSSSANLITSAVNPVISPSSGSSPVTVTILNNGNATASAINIYATNPMVIQNSNCASTLAMNQTCTFQINVTSSISGQSSAVVSYTNTQGAQILTINTSYISTASSPLLTLTPSGNGSFTNTGINQGYTYMTVNVKNTGTITLQNLAFNNLNIANPAMNSYVNGSTCVNGGSLSVNSSCNMIISYNPTSISSGSVYFIATGTYSGQDGNTLTYSNSSLTIPYSSVSTAIFKAVGDFGMVISSPAGGASGTWTANVDNPYPTTSSRGYSMLLNNGTYVMSIGTGSIKYSNLNGLFWQNSPIDSTATLSAINCGIAYDGTYYYSCGTLGTPFNSTCTIGGRACIIRTNNLNSSWTPLFMTTESVVMNNIYYFSGGGNSAYVASIASTVSNAGLATSTNGSSWVSTSSGQATAANNNFNPVAFNTTSNLLIAWDSAGWSSGSSISAASSTWAANTTIRPGSVFTTVNDAIYQNGLYTLVASNGNIYTTANPTVSYTQSQNPDNESRLTKVIYASGINSGTYFAVGNSGLNLTATNPAGVWTAQTQLSLSPTSLLNLTGLYYDGTAVWITGVSAMFKSTNGSTWITPGLQSIAKNGSTYLAVDNMGNIYSSANASTWTQQVNPTQNILNYIYCASQNLCFAVGNSGTILKTTNGTTWSQLTSNTNNNLNGMVCQNGTCIVVGGSGNSNSGTVLSSSDYTSWSTISTSLATTGLNSVAVFDSVYYAVGNTGSIFSSSNGVNWMPVTSPTSNNLYSIACSSSLGCVTSGASGTYMFSSSGTRWVIQTTSATADFRSAAYSNGMFVIVGQYGSMKVSTTGSSAWTNATFPTTSSNSNNLNAVIGDN